MMDWRRHFNGVVRGLVPNGGKDNAKDCHIGAAGYQEKEVQSLAGKACDDDNDVENDREDEVGECDIKQRSDAVSKQMYNTHVMKIRIKPNFKVFLGVMHTSASACHTARLGSMGETTM
jgi:hypothetical protein